MNIKELGACAMALNLHARLFLEAPDHELLSGIKEARIFDQWPLPCPGGASAGALRFLRDRLAQYDESGLTDVRAEYNTLFVNPDQPVPLWESVWTTKEKLLFDGPMFDVREQYARYGLSSPNPEHEPDDHIGLELSFLGGVMGCAATSLENGEDADAREHAVAAANFLQKHISGWAPRFLNAVADRADTPFYGAVSLLCGSVIDHAAALLKDIQA